MEENIIQGGKQKKKRRELLIIVLFQLASISLCAVSLVFKIGDTLANEFIPVALHAANEGDYSADQADFKFRKANPAIIMDILFDHDPGAEDIAVRSTAIAYNLLTPVPTITPNFADPSTINSEPTIKSSPPVDTPYPTKQSEVTPTLPGASNPSPSTTTNPPAKPITLPTNPPRLPSVTPTPTKVPRNSAPGVDPTYASPSATMTSTFCDNDIRTDRDGHRQQHPHRSDNFNQYTWTTTYGDGYQYSTSKSNTGSYTNAPICRHAGKNCNTNCNRNWNRHTDVYCARHLNLNSGPDIYANFHFYQYTLQHIDSNSN